MRTQIISLHSLAPCRRFTYISTKEMDKIKQEPIGLAKRMYKLGKFYGKEGYETAKSDIRLYLKNRKKDATTFTPEQHWEMERIRSDLIRIPPVVVLFMVPAGLVMIVLYAAFLPSLTPTSFRMDSFRNAQLLEIKKYKEQALQYFRNAGMITISEDKSISHSLKFHNLLQMSLYQLKMVSWLCFGRCVDGTQAIRNVFGLSLDFFLFQQLSQQICYRNLEKFLRFYHPHLPLEDIFDARVREAIKQLI